MEWRSGSDYPYPSSPDVSIRMRANRGRNTGPERVVRSLLHGSGLRYRVHFAARVDQGRPISIDVAFPAIKLAVFIDGCFWHGCNKHRTVPVANASYWGPKLSRNVERDKITTVRLEADGWHVRRYWEHDDPTVVAADIAVVVTTLRGNAGRTHITVSAT